MKSSAVIGVPSGHCRSSRSFHVHTVPSSFFSGRSAAKFGVKSNVPFSSLYVNSSIFPRTKPRTSPSADVSERCGFKVLILPPVILNTTSPLFASVVSSAGSVVSVVSSSVSFVSSVVVVSSGFFSSVGALSFLHPAKNVRAMNTATKIAISLFDIYPPCFLGLALYSVDIYHYIHYTTSLLFCKEFMLNQI